MAQPRASVARPTEFADGPIEDRPEPEDAGIPARPPPRPSTTSGTKPSVQAAKRAASDYPARNILTRQTPQTVLIVGISLLLGVCVMASLLVSAGANAAGGFLIICGGPLALFITGTGVVLLLTRGRTGRF